MDPKQIFEDPIGIYASRGFTFVELLVIWGSGVLGAALLVWATGGYPL